MVSAGNEAVVLQEARMLVPQNLPGNVTWQGGSQAGPDPAVTHTQYLRNEVPQPSPDASWTEAYVYEKHERTPGNSSTAFYRRFTFAKDRATGVVDPTPTAVADRDNAGGSPWYLSGSALTAVQAIPVTPDLGNPPPPPPPNPQRPGPPGLVVRPSQFYTLARRLRIVLWQTS